MIDVWLLVGKILSGMAWQLAATGNALFDPLACNSCVINDGMKILDQDNKQKGKEAKNATWRERRIENKGLEHSCRAELSTIWTRTV